MSCGSCKWARLAGNKGDNIVGCALLAADDIRIKDVKHGPVFQGWHFTNRLPHEKESGVRPFDGAMLFGPYLVSVEAKCFKYASNEERIAV